MQIVMKIIEAAGIEPPSGNLAAVEKSQAAYGPT